MQVKQILREKGNDVISITSDATLSEAARLLARKRIGAVIVRDAKGDLAGILSERDVVRAVATCTDFDTVDELMEMMTHGRFRHVPVLDENEQLMGIVSIGDVVKTRIEETVREAASLREYIAAAG